MGEGSGRHLGGIRRHLGGIWEESGMHLEASGRHLRGTSGVYGPGGILEPERQLGAKCVQKHCVVQCWRSQGTVSLAFWSLDLHVDRKFTATYAARSAGEADDHPTHPLQNRQDPYR